MTLWLVRNRRKAIGLLAVTVIADGIGLMMTLTGWPVDAAVALGMHALLCSVSLPAALMSLCME